MSRGLRVKKSRSMMWSLYGLSGIAGLAYLLLVLLVAVYIAKNLDFDALGEVFKIFSDGFYFIAVAMLFSFPFALALCFLIVLNTPSKFASNLQKALRIIDQSPILISGLFFLVIFGGGWKSLYLTCSFLAVSKLSYRWIKLSNVVSSMQIDTAKSLGMNIWQIVYLLYIKKFLKMYVGHYLSVACFLFSVVTPFVCILNVSEQYEKLFSVYFFRLLGTGTGPVSLMAATLLLIHFGRLWFDSTAFYSETEHG